MQKRSAAEAVACNPAPHPCGAVSRVRTNCHMSILPRSKIYKGARPCLQPLHPHSLFRSVFDTFGPTFGVFASSGLICSILALTWAELGPSWHPLGPTWRPTWPQLALSWLPSGGSEGCLGVQVGFKLGFQVHFNTETKKVYFVFAGQVDSSLRAL